MLPDDTKIEGRKEKGIQELQDVYSEGGMSLVRAVVEDIFHIPIPYYATFTADSFSKMVDLSGGVPIYVEKNMYHGDEATRTAICRGRSGRNGSSRTSMKTGRTASA